MVSQIYFYDGSVKELVLPDANPDKLVLINSGDGYTHNIFDFNQLQILPTEYYVITNNPELLSFEFCTDIFLYNFLKKKYVSIHECTEKELHTGHNLRKLWIGNAFSHTKNFIKYVN